MTRNIRKIVSVICAVALLLSLCAVSFIGSSSAVITKEDDATVTNTWVTDEVVLNLTFDTAGGIPLATSGIKTYEGGAFVYGNTGGGMGAAWLGKDSSVTTISSSTTYTTANSPKANLFQLKANTTYKVTYKVAYRNDCNENLQVQWMAATDPYLSSGHGRADGLTTKATMIDGVDLKAPAPAGGTDFGAWQEETLIFTMGDADKYLGFRQHSAADGNKIFKIDYIKIETGAVQENIVLNDIDKEYVFDYTNETVQDAVIARQTAIAGNSNTSLVHYSWYNWDGWMIANKSWSTEGSYPGKPGFTSEGMNFHIGKGANLAADDTATWVSNAPIFDPAVGNADGYGNNGGYIKLKDEASYLISIKFKVTKVTGSYLRLAVGAMSSGTSGMLDVIPASFVEIKTASNEWQTLTFGFDTGVDTKFADKIITLCGATSGDQMWNSVIVDSITIKEKRDVENGMAVMKFVDGSNAKYDLVSVGPMTLPTLESTADASFAGWYTSANFAEGTKVEMNNFVPAKGTNVLYARWSKTAAVVTYNNCGVETSEKLAVGLELPNATRPNAYLFFEGWYTDTDFTNKVTTVPDYDVTLYAKYNGTFLNFNNIANVAGETSGTPELVADPADANNTVVRFTAKADSRLNMMLPAYDVAGAKPFELKTNTTYIVTFKVKLVNDNGISVGCDLYQGDVSKYDANATTRTAISGAGGVATSATEWTNVTCTFTTGDTFYLERVKWSYQNHIFFTIYNSKDAAAVYLDDFSISEILTEAPEGTVGVYFETNSTDMPTMYGFTGETIPALGNPVLAGHEFVGWYVDKQLTVPFTSKFFGDKDITVYAKWKAIPFLVDFSDYEKGTFSARAKFVKDDKGNDYLDWWVNYADSNTSDTGTPYRVFMNKGGVHYTCEKGQQYTFTFKYKLLDAEVDNVTIAGVTTTKLNGWGSYKVCDEKLLLNKVTNDWTTASLTFTADPVDNGGRYLSFGIAGHGHVLIDDIQISAAGARANLYGSSAIFFNPNGGENVDAISGDPGEKMPKLPTTTKKGYAFNGWFTDAELTTPFTAKTWGEEDITLYAGWILGKFTESYEDFPKSALATGISGGYSLYQDTTTGFDKANVQNGKVSIFRNGTQTGSKAFTLCRESTIYLAEGKQYTLTFYVKPSNVTDAAGTINLIGMKSNTGIAAPQSTNVITTVGDLKAGEWQKVSYTFTADAQYIGISTTAGNDMYLDNFTVTLKNYTGTTTGDNSVSPILITLMIVLAAGSLVITGKKVFEK